MYRRGQPSVSACQDTPDSAVRLTSMGEAAQRALRVGRLLYNNSMLRIISQINGRV